MLGRILRVGRIAVLGALLPAFVLVAGSASAQPAVGAQPLPDGRIELVVTLPGFLGPEIELEVVGLGPTGEPVASAGEGIEHLPPSRVMVPMRRASDHLYDEGYSRYFSSKTVRILSDLRASLHYERTDDEDDECPRCEAKPGETPDNAIEVLSGEMLAIRLPQALRERLAGRYSEAQLERAETLIRSTRWEMSPSLEQEPTLSPSLGTGDVAPGLLLHSGEMTLEVVDLAIAGRGLDLVFTRTYRNQTLGAGPLGPGWEMGFRERLRERPNGDVELYDGRGRRELFRKVGEDEGAPEYEAPRGRFDELTKHPAGWARREPSGLTTRYDLFGRLQVKRDARKEDEDTGNEITFEYDYRSRLATVTDTLGRVVRLRYNNDDRLTSIEDFSGREVVYGYDELGRLTSVRSPRVTSGPRPYPDGLTVRYEYESPTGSLARQLAMRDNLTAVIDAKGETVLTLDYADARGQGRPDDVVSQTWGEGTIAISYSGTTSVVTDRRGNARTYVHDDDGHLTQLTDAEDAAWSWTYDLEGRMTDATRPLGGTTTWLYGSGGCGDGPAGESDRRAQGNVGRITVTADSRGDNGSGGSRSWCFDYDERTNQVTKTIDARGTMTRIERDEWGQPTAIHEAEGSDAARTTTLEWNDYGQLEREVNASGHITEWTYFEEGDQEGYLESVTVDPGELALTRSWRRDELGRVTAEIDPRGVHHEQSWNELDQLVERKQAAAGAGDVAALGIVWQWLYDENGRLEEEHIPGFGGSLTTSYVYGALGELEEESHALGGTAGSATTRYTHDANLNVVMIEGPNGQMTQIDYDDENRSTAVTRGHGTAEAATTTLTLDDEGQVITREDSRGHAWAIERDGYGRVKTSIPPLGARRELRYDAAGAVESTRAVAGGETLAETDFVYDALGRPVTETAHLFGPAPGTVTTARTYNPLGQVITEVDPAGSVMSLTYDTADRLASVTDALGNSTTFERDAAGNVTEIKTLERRASGETVEVTETRTYDALGRLASDTDGVGQSRLYSYDSRGNLIGMSDELDASTSWTYDGLDRRLSESRPRGITTTWTVDASGRITAVKDALGNLTSWTHDALDRVKTRTYADGSSWSYSHDGEGNVTGWTDGNGTVVTQTHDDAGRLTARTITPGAGTGGVTSESYTWDALDRLVSADGGGISLTLGYDSLSRLVSEAVNGRSVSHTLDARGNRTATTYPSGYALTRTFDALGRLDRILQGETPLADYGYRGAGLVETAALGASVEFRAEHDLARRPTERTAHTASTSDTEPFGEYIAWTARGEKFDVRRQDRHGRSRGYRYDEAGRVTSVEFLPGRGPFQPGESPTSKIGAQYDGAQNLLNRQRTAGVPFEPDRSTPVAGNPRNRPTHVNGIALGWDANGNLIQKGSTSFSYDYRNRLVRVVRDGVERVRYDYDMLDRRVRASRADGTVEETAWSGWQELESYEGNVLPTLRNRTVHGAGLDEIVAFQSDGDGIASTGIGGLEQTALPIYDASGNVALLLDGNGKLLEQYAYTTHGERRVEVDALQDGPSRAEVRDNKLRLSGNEALRTEALQRAQANGTLVLTQQPVNPNAGQRSTPALAQRSLTVSSVSHPVRASYAAGREVELVFDPAPTPGATTHLVVPAEAIEDEFGNHPAQGIDQTFLWPQPGETLVLFDTAAREVEEIYLLNGKLVVGTSEPITPAEAASAFLVDDAPVAWQQGYTPYHVEHLGLSPGEHTITTVTAALAARAGDPPAEASETTLAERDTPRPLNYTPSEPFRWVLELTNARELALSAAGNDYGFHGRPVDPETGLVYFRHRWYDPELGRFLSPDPLGYADGPNDVQAFLNDPVNGADPMGLTSRTGVTQEDVFYDWRLGWIDLSHADNQLPELREAWKRLKEARTGESIQFTLRMDQMRGTPLFKLSETTFTIEALPTIEERERQLLYAFQKHSEQFEDFQSRGVQRFQIFTTIYGLLTGEEEKIASGRSTEDLVSDLIAFYAAVRDSDRASVIASLGLPIAESERRELSLLIWDYALKPRVGGAQNWVPVLINPGAHLSPDPVAKTALVPIGPVAHIAPYGVSNELSQRNREMQRLRTLLEKYVGLYGQPKALELGQPLAAGVRVDAWRDTP